MFMPERKVHPVFKIVNNVMVDLPSPSSISLWWNMGSLLGLCLVVQILTGVFLSFHYSAHSDFSFDSVTHISQNVALGWFFRSIHVNGGTLFFVCMYIHMGRSLFYGSYLNTMTWSVGVLLFILTMATAFLGYVLPWGQMSFWGATVITSLFSAIPYVGASLVEWLWGGYALTGVTLTRFYSLHFLLPFVIIAFTMVHIMFLHQSGSSNPLGVLSNSDKIPFHPYYSSKDIMGFAFAFFFLFYVSLYWPVFLCEADNFYYANPLVTPSHIQPEWYFLYVYAILRSIPNKLGGVVALASSILVLFLLPFLHFGKYKSHSLYPLSQVMFWGFVSTFMLLTWIGARPVEDPYILIGQILTFLYFAYFLFLPFLQVIEDRT
uniref:Cytochrome b n=1 Tax=Falcidens acutargatus TaxID=2079778 RepID=A0A343X866_9MOLL|nr:cytochrome b [Falcidens acutargatus]AWH02125.1 cytochrome b [Falcidens acutargatus]